MAPAIITITIGGMLIFSALKGVGILDVLTGESKGDNLDPHGGSGSGSGGGASSPSSSDGGFTSIVPPSNGGKWSVPAGGASSFKGPNAKLLDYLAGIAQNRFHLTITATTNGGHVNGSYHYRGRAFDCSGSEADMAAFDNFVGENFQAVIAELIHNPGPINIKDGQRVAGSQVYAGVWAGHRNHVHVAA